VIGRGSETAAVESLIADAAHGRSGALLVAGEAGVGKTLLLAHAREVARGARVLEAAGGAGGSNLAFAGLATLLGPVLDHLVELPTPQAAALRGALSLVPSRPVPVTASRPTPRR